MKCRIDHELKMKYYLVCVKVKTCSIIDKLLWITILVGQFVNDCYDWCSWEWKSLATSNQEIILDGKECIIVSYMHVFYKIQCNFLLWRQERWDKEVGNKLHAIMPQIDEKYYSGCTNRKDEVIINRLRIGHTRLTHSFRMENRPHPPLCDQGITS